MIALFLWVVARGSSSVERGFDIPVVLQGVPDDLVVVDRGADVVNVRLLGTRSALRNFDPERLEYPLEVSEAKPGQADFEVDLSRFDLPRGRARGVAVAVAHRAFTRAAHRQDREGEARSRRGRPATATGSAAS